MNNGFRLGLDIGVASVGWGIIGESEEIIDAGVRLFPEGGNSVTSAIRREKRGARRLLRRRKHRNERLRQLLLEYKIIDNFNYNFCINQITPYELRVKGLNNILSRKELASVLLNLIKRRGIHNFEIKCKESKDEKGTKDILFQNNKKLEKRYICELQFERLKNNNIDIDNGLVRGKRNVFRTEDYKKEALKILKTQKNGKLGITDEFITKYIDILERRREYYTGPDKHSIYGWKDEMEWIDRLFGKCTYYPEETRMCKNSYTAQLFNLLNDLNNLTIKREGNMCLTKREKERLIELFKSQNPTLKRILKIIDVKESDISGYRMDKNKKPLFTSLTSYKDINSIFKIEDRDLIDEICKILTVYQTNDKIIEKIKELGIEIDDEQVLKINSLKPYTGSHSLSKKAMEEILEELLETNKNQMELFTEKGLVPYKMNFKGKNNIPKNYIKEWILSPVVKRAVSQTINILNAVHKKYGIPDEVVIEMAREKNSDDKKEFLKKIQKENEKVNKKIKEYLSERNYSKNSKLFNKIKLWDEQDGRCLYSGKNIKIEDLLNRPELFEIDHIIPRSISFDDSQNNKVLVMREENQNKKNMSPFQYLSSSGRYDEFKSRVEVMKLNIRKQENLLFEGELNRYSRKFIARNLVDTRYATREILNLLKKYYKDNNYNVKVKSVTGAMTHQVRKMWKFPKNRELSHSHHAQDALIMLSSEKILNSLKNVKNYNENTEEQVIDDLKIGEILTDNEYKKLFKYEYGKRIKSFNRYKYSHYVDKKPNRQFTDETIYSTRLVKEKNEKKENEYIISKKTDIYNKKTKDIKKFFENKKDQEKLLMYHNDYKTFLKFMNVYETYKKEKNPFFAYYNEHKKFITKYAKKDNGPPVMSFKYRTSELGNYLDISNKYNVKGKKIVMCKIKSLRTDIYKKENIYKFINVTYLMMEDKGKYYEVNNEKYENLKEKKAIDSSYKFQFSLYSGDIFEIDYKNKDKKKEKVKFKSVNNDKKKYEVDFIDRFNSNYIDIIKELKKILETDSDIDSYYFKKIVENKLGDNILDAENLKQIIEKYPITSKQKVITIGRDIKSLRKIYVDILGNEYNSQESFVSKIYK